MYCTALSNISCMSVPTSVSRSSSRWPWSGPVSGQATARWAEAGRWGAGHGDPGGVWRLPRPGWWRSPAPALTPTCWTLVTGPLYVVPIPRILVGVKELLTFKIWTLKVGFRISSYLCISLMNLVRLSVEFPDARWKWMGQCVVWWAVTRKLLRVVLCQARYLDIYSVVSSEIWYLLSIKWVLCSGHSIKQALPRSQTRFNGCEDKWKDKNML